MFVTSVDKAFLVPNKDTAWNAPSQELASDG